VLNGRYGPYVTDGKKNAKIPKDREPKDLTLDECQAMIEAAPERRGRRGAKKTAKKTAAKKTTAKKTKKKKKKATKKRSKKKTGSAKEPVAEPSLAAHSTGSGPSEPLS
jgi:DNA topoisomerase-1